MKRTVSLLLDVIMLVIFASLMSWRFTGVSVHEWAATGLAVILVIHLLIHWHWIETRVARLRTGSNRTRVNVILNLALFVTMGVALASGFAISKVMFPNGLTAADYQRWHSVHETSSTLTLVVLGLHVALNWDLITHGIRRAFRRRPSAGAARPQTAGIRWGSRVLRPLAAITLATALVTGLAKGLDAVMPQEKVLFTHADGTRELADPPADIARTHPGDTEPNLKRGGAGALFKAVMLGGVALIGRKALRIRL